MEKKRLTTLDYFSAFALFMIVVVVTAQIIWRYVFNSSLSWSEELSRYIFIWLIFVGGSLGIKEKSHIKVEFLSILLNRKTRRVVDVALYFIIIMVQVYYLIFSIQFIIRTHGTYSTAMQLPMNIAVYPSIAVGCLVSLYYCIRGLMQAMKTDSLFVQRMEG